MPFWIALLWAAVSALLLVRAALQFRAYSVITPAADGGKDLPTVRVVVPVRNEERNIATCVGALLAQDYPVARLETVMVDDGSSDQTAALARRTAGSRPDFRLLAAGGLPLGWTGKAHACWRGAADSRSEWLCFIDADTLADPPLLRSAVAYAEKHGIDMLSIEPEQVLGTFWERVILPAGMFLMAFFATDLRAINDPCAADAAANGQFILIRRRVYQAIGGHAAVRGEISEDTALARRVKQAGFRTFLAGSRDLIQVRMYTRLGEIWEGLSKNAVNVVNSRRTALIIALEGVLVGWLALLLPAWAAVGLIAAPGTAALGGLLLTAAGSLALTGIQMAGARYFRIPMMYGLLYPLGYSLIAAIVGNSVLCYRQGRVRWKGRVYVPPADTAGAISGEETPAGESDCILNKASAGESDPSSHEGL